MNLFESTFNAGMTRLFLHSIEFFMIHVSYLKLGVTNNTALLEINNEK